MSALLLHDREVGTFFDLMGHAENDMTAALGWSLAQSPRLLTVVVGAVTMRGFEPAEAVVRLQEHHAEGGFSDVEVQIPDRLHIIFEAKRGWNLPTHDQLALYSRRFAPDQPEVVQAIVVLTQWGAESMVERQLGDWPLPYPRLVLGWSDLVRLTQQAVAVAPPGERRLLKDLAMYLRGVADMRDTDSNRVFVVVLNRDTGEGWPMNNIEIVEQHNKYFFPATGKRWPKVPPNYMGFRYGGHLRYVRHVDGYVIDTDMSRHFPGAPSVEWEPHFVLTLGPAIQPDHPVPNGRSVQQANHVWADIDLLLTAKSITEAWQLSHARRATESG